MKELPTDKYDFDPMRYFIIQIVFVIVIFAGTIVAALMMEDLSAIDMVAFILLILGLFSLLMKFINIYMLAKTYYLYDEIFKDATEPYLAITFYSFQQWEKENKKELEYYKK